MNKLRNKCRTCEEPLWDGPCTCKAWCKSRVCKVSFIGKMNELMVEAQLADTVLTMDQWYEQTTQRRQEVREREPVLHSSCTCTWCREFDRRVHTWQVRNTHYYSVRDSRGRFVGEVGNSSPYPNEGYAT